MQKRKIIGILLLSILSISLVSAFSFSDITKFLGRITGNVVSEPPTSGLVAYYSGDGSLSNGTWIGTPSYSSGKSGQAFSFSGNNYISTTIDNNFVNDFTVSVWTKPSSKYGYFNVIWGVGTNDQSNYNPDIQNPVLMHGGGGGYVNDTVLYFLSPYCGSQWVDTGYRFTDTNWHNIITKREGNSYYIFVDGVQTPNTAIASGCTATSGPFIIGYQQSF